MLLVCPVCNALFESQRTWWRVREVGSTCGSEILPWAPKICDGVLVAYPLREVTKRNTKVSKTARLRVTRG